MNKEKVIDQVKKGILSASTGYKKHQIDAYNEAIAKESKPQSKWVLENIIKNEEMARAKINPLCDDTGIPHLILEIGKNRSIDGEFIDAIYQGVIEGLRELPGRPMALMGNDLERIEQSGGISKDPGDVVPAPLLTKLVEGNDVKLHILLQGGGPEIRGRTYRIFHKRSIDVIINEIAEWAKDEVSKLGCTPCVPAIGIGRTHFEATSLMLQSMVEGNYGIQNEIEQKITNKINETNVGPLGIGGDTTALATFLKVGPQRASGVRIVSMRLCCIVEPRVATVLFEE